MDVSPSSPRSIAWVQGQTARKVRENPVLSKNQQQDDRLLHVHSALLASQEWIDTKPNTLKAVLRGLKAATNVINHERPRAIAVMQKLLHLDEVAVTKIMAENSYSLAIDDGLARSIAFQSDWAVDIKRIPAPVTAKQVIDPTLLHAVDPSLVSWTD